MQSKVIILIQCIDIELLGFETMVMNLFSVINSSYIIKSSYITKKLTFPYTNIYSLHFKNVLSKFCK